MSCIVCGIQLASDAEFKNHFKTDWHCYNLKRKACGLPFVTFDIYQIKSEAAKSLSSETTPQLDIACQPCHKVFHSQKAYDNHCNAKTHLEKLQQSSSLSQSIISDIVENEKPVEVEKGVKKCDQTESDDPDFENTICIEDCLFCEFTGRSLQKTLNHMKIQHSFFIPDEEFLVDLVGLKEYLNDKVGIGFLCLWCDEKGKSFNSLKSVQSHMIDKGHTKLFFDNEAALEYSDFYDYSSSYPQDIDEDDQKVEELVNLTDSDVLSDDDKYWILPSGITIGNRFVLKMFQPRYPQSGLNYINKNKKRELVKSYSAQVIAHSSKWHSEGSRLKDLAFLQKCKQKYYLKMGVKNNKFQPYFRDQTMMF